MRVTHALETALVRATWAMLAAFGPVWASDRGGALARVIGPRLPVSDVARRNLAMALPELSAAAREAVVRGMWDNLGRTAAELPHVAALHESRSGPGYELDGVEHLPVRGPAVLVSGHLGNWEFLPLVAARLGTPVASFYRAASNAGVDRIISAQRGRASGAPSFAKGAAGARQALAWLRQGGMVAMLVDQKMNDGIKARLFGRPAMTATAAAAFALRYRCPIVPARAVRLGPARMRIVCEPPLPIPQAANRAADIAALTQAINDRLEAWIREEPAQWLWLHRRWPHEAYSSDA